MSAYYNEIEPYAAEWLRNLIAAGHIADGTVDTRSIEDVRPSDLVGFTQCHFFAGIGGWSRALRLASWPDDRPVWTGSCPCQPFSAAGKGGGFADERHLWPAWFHLIGQCRPCVIFGEQVASKDGLGWLDLVYADLEAAGYACGAFDLCAAGVGAPHIRQRQWIVADAESARLSPGGMRTVRPVSPSNSGDGNGTPGNGRQQWRTESSGRDGESFWSRADWLPCMDGKARAVESGTFPLAHGVPARVGKVRAYGNAIVPQGAAEVIGAYMEIPTPGAAP